MTAVRPLGRYGNTYDISRTTLLAYRGIRLAFLLTVILLISEQFLPDQRYRLLNYIGFWGVLLVTVSVAIGGVIASYAVARRGKVVSVARNSIAFSEADENKPIILQIYKVLAYTFIITMIVVISIPIIIDIIIGAPVPNGIIASLIVFLIFLYAVQMVDRKR